MVVQMKLVLVLIFVLLNVWFCYSSACLEEERIALLRLKASINHPNGVSLTTWLDTEESSSSDCCMWDRVTCNITTGRVARLDLDQTRLDGLGDWYLDVSLLLPFEHLRRLNLSDNSLAGFVDYQDFEKQSWKLSNLKTLDLSINNLNNTILSSLSWLSSLEHLYLEANDFIGSNEFEELSRLKSLEVLDLSQNFQLRNISYLGGLSSLRVLRVSNARLRGTFQLEQLKNLVNLKKLVLSRNHIEAFEPIRGANMSSLEVLSLTANSIRNNIFSSLGRFSSLKSLYLGMTNVKGPIYLKELNALSNLEYLDISDNSVVKFVASRQGIKTSSKLRILRMDAMSSKASILLQSLGSFVSLETLYVQRLYERGDYEGIALKAEDFYNLTNLEELFVDDSPIDNNFLQGIGRLASLKILSLYNCRLDGTLPTEGWCELKHLEELDLSHNKLAGILPSCMSNMTTVRVLDISYNQFSGNIASNSALETLTSLEFISFANNQFEATTTSFESFANHSKLKVILSDNILLVPEDVLAPGRTVAPRFQLNYFSMKNCTWKGLESNDVIAAGPARFLHHQSDLRAVDLSFTGFGGNFPGWLLENNTRLEKLYFRSNSFSGPFLLPSRPNPHMVEMDISNNNIGGHIPRNISFVFPNLETLNMSGDALDGEVPPQFCSFRFLENLDMSGNNLTGGIEDQFSKGCYSLALLRLSDNRLTGELHGIKSNLRGLKFLDLGNNKFHGNIPKWLGDRRELSGVFLSRNEFTGPIPEEICNLHFLRDLDLSENNLSGYVPSCPNQRDLRRAHLNKNRLSGPLGLAFAQSLKLMMLDLSDNNLTSTIPGSIGNLFSLNFLILKGNNFHGEIPIELCYLEELTRIDLSHNELSGPIPPCLSKIPFEVTYEEYSQVGVFHDRDDFLKALSYVTVKVFEERPPDGNWFSAVSRDQIEIGTKGNVFMYTGLILASMSSMDLSSNELSGEIPPGIGKLSNIRGLNLSHNHLNGSIPKTFKKLKQVESLDLSHNELSGEIPSQLTDLNSLAVFSVAYNNLSGAVPERRAQFGTFDKKSYEGNPLLCGPPLRSCTENNTDDSNAGGEDGGNDVDMFVFCVIFGVSYAGMFLGVLAVLYVNPRWRRAWFYYSEAFVYKCYYFVLDNACKLCRFKNM